MMKFKLIFESFYLMDAWHDLVKIWNVEYQQWRASPQQKLSSFVEAAQNYVCTKVALLFFLSIYPPVWHDGFDTLLCVLILCFLSHHNKGTGVYLTNPISKASLPSNFLPVNASSLDKLLGDSVTSR